MAKELRQLPVAMEDLGMLGRLLKWAEYMVNTW
jgi:hypothetical protein